MSTPRTDPVPYAYQPTGKRRQPRKRNKQFRSTDSFIEVAKRCRSRYFILRQELVRSICPQRQRAYGATREHACLVFSDR